MDKHFTNTRILLDRIQKIAGIGIWIQDTRSDESWWSDQTYKIFGLKPQSRIINFNSFLEMVIPEYREMIAEKTQQALLSDKNSYNVDYEIIRKDNKRRIIHEEAVIERDEKGNPIQMTGIIQDVTEQRKAEQALKASEKNFRLLFENSPLGIYVANRHGKILEVNQSALNILGSPSVEATKQINVLKFPPLVKNGYADALQKCIKSEKPITLEICYKSKWGKESYLFSYIIPLKEEPGKAMKIYTVMEDITERKNAEQALKNSEEKYKQLSHQFRLMSDNIPDLVWAKDLDCNFTFVNKALCQRLLIAKDTNEPIGKKDMYFAARQRNLHPERKDWHTFGEICVNSDEIVLKNKKPQRFDEYGNVEGEFLFLDVYKAPIFDETGNIIGTVGHGRIVTKEKEIEKKLTESENRLRALSEATYEAIFISDKGICIETNEAASRLFGYKYEELIGIFGTAVIAPESKEFVKQNMLSGYEKPYDAIALRKDGTKFPAEFLGRMFKYKDRKVRITAVRDITERKKAEQELKEKEAKLEKSNKTKDKFFSIIAHDLKAPFNTLLGFSNLLYENFDDYSKEEQKEFLNIIRNGINSSYKLLENLLVWSRSQRGAIKFKPEKINLHLLTNEIQKLLNQSILKKSILFENKIAGKFYVYADKDMLSTIIRNLLSNAIKFTPKGGNITLVSRLKKTIKSQEYVEISVKDSGVGISEQMQSKLFDIGEAISTRGTENEKGTGLGLILCKEFVEKHNGEIWVESKVGKGTTFYFSIPINPNDDINIENALKTYTILIVDDEEVNYLYINLILKNSGFNLNTFYVRTAQEAIDFCKNHPGIDIVLMDIRMPKMDGYEITRQIRKTNKKMTIVAQTSFALEGDREKALAAGCNDYIQKPVDKEKLLKMIEKLVQT
jgi:PAS domain S-box-containing protein